MMATMVLVASFVVDDTVVTVSLFDASVAYSCDQTIVDNGKVFSFISQNLQNIVFQKGNPDI